MEKNSKKSKIYSLSAILLRICSILVIIIGIMAKIILKYGWTRTENLWYYIGGGIVLFGLSLFFFFIPTLLKRRNPKEILYYPDSKLKRKLFGLMVLSVVIFSSLLVGISFLNEKFINTQSIVLLPREYEIEYNENYTFSTQYGNLNETSEILFPRNQALPTNPDSYAWGEAYNLRTYTHMYNTTKNITYLNMALERMDVVYANRDVNNDSIPGYGSGTVEYTSNYVECLVCDGVILRSLAEAANIIKNDENLWNNASYRERADNYINISDLVIARWNSEHWHEDFETNGGYWLCNHYLRPIFNRIHAFAQLVMQVYDYTGEQSYLNQIIKVARFFKSELYLKTYTSPDKINGSYQQREMYHWGYDTESINSDTSHANLDVEFVYWCHIRGIVFDKTDMERFANTFADFYYRGRDWQTSSIIDGINATLNFADGLSGSYRDGRFYFVYLRIGWYYLYEFYHDPAISAYIVLTSLEDLIRGGHYSETIGQMTCACLRELIYMHPEHYHQFSPHL